MSSRFSKGRIIGALVIAAISLISYFGMRVYNPVTDEMQHISLDVEQETALGLQAAPELAKQFQGLHPDGTAQARVDSVGNRILSRSAAGKSPWKFDFHLLADEKTINAFALPGGQVFITAALFNRLRTEGQLAGVIGHEIGHVVARHGAEHIAKAELTQGLTGAAVLATYDPQNPNGTPQIAELIGQLVNMKFGREDELESDRLGVRFLAESGYDPRVLIEVMRILAESSEGGSRPPEFFSTHPTHERRVEQIEAAIAEQFPSGVPAGLTQ